MNAGALLVLNHLSAAMIGGGLGYLLGRPPRRGSSIVLSVNGATRQGRGRHRHRR